MRGNAAIAVLAFLAGCVAACGQQRPTNAPAQPRPDAAKATPVSPAPLPNQPQMQEPPALGTMLKKTVAFLTLDFQDGAKTGQLRGTGFFVYYEDKRLGENRGFVYFVTNRHMAEPKIEGRPVRVTREIIRLNLKAPRDGVQSAEVELSLGGETRWYFPTDESTDLAVMPLAPEQSLIDINPFPVSMFATRDVIKARNIAEGDSVLFTGFFYQFPGQKKIEPIVRQGILAMMPDEDLTTTLGNPGHIYLADVHVFGGNSGSPMFVSVGGFRGGSVIVGGFPYLLLGVVSGYFYEAQDFKLEVATTISGSANANSGISMVVPADELRALLDTPALQAVRDTQVGRLRR